MFKQQLSPRSVHPYQTTVVPRSEQQFASSSQQRAKFPWAEDINTPVYQVTGTDSSTSENAYNVGHFTTCKLPTLRLPTVISKRFEFQVPQYFTGTMREYVAQSPVYQAPYGTGTWRSYKKVEKIPAHMNPDVMTFPQCASAFSLPLCELDPRSHTPGRSPLPPIPSVSPEVPIIGACGGHCPGFEYVCYYILQVNL